MTRTPEITHCGRTVAADFVAWDVRWEGDLPDGTDVRWSMVVSDGEEEISLVHARVGGSVEQYVVGPRGREDVEADTDLSDGEITARFPADLVGVATEWPVWTAVLSVGDEDVSRMVVPAG